MAEIESMTSISKRGPKEAKDQKDSQRKVISLKKVVKLINQICMKYKIKI